MNVRGATEVWAYRLGDGTWRVEGAGVVIASGATLPDALRAAADRVEGDRAAVIPTATAPRTQRLLTTRDVADRLRVSMRNVQDALNAGKLRGIRVGKLWRVDEDEYAAFVARLRAGTITW